MEPKAFPAIEAMLFTVFPSFFVSNPAAFMAFTTAFCIFLTPAVILSQFLYTRTAATAMAPRIRTILPPGPRNAPKLLAPLNFCDNFPNLTTNPPIPVVIIAIILIAGPTAAAISAVFTMNSFVDGLSLENLSASPLTLSPNFVMGGTTTDSTDSPNTVMEFFRMFTVFLILLIGVCISFKALSVLPEDLFNFFVFSLNVSYCDPVNARAAVNAREFPKSLAILSDCPPVSFFKIERTPDIPFDLIIA